MFSTCLNVTWHWGGGGGTAVPISERAHATYAIHDVTKRSVTSILHYDVTFHGALVRFFYIRAVGRLSRIYLQLPKATRLCGVVIYLSRGEFGRVSVPFHWGQPHEATVVKMAPTRPLASRSFCLLALLCDHRSLSNLQQRNTEAWYTFHQNDRLVPFLVFVQ